MAGAEVAYCASLVENGAESVGCEDFVGMPDIEPRQAAVQGLVSLQSIPAQ